MLAAAATSASTAATTSASPRRRTISGTARTNSPYSANLAALTSAVGKRIAVASTPARAAVQRSTAAISASAADERQSAAPQRLDAEPAGCVDRREHDDQGGDIRERDRDSCGAGAADQVRVVALVDAQQRRAEREDECLARAGAGAEGIHGCSYTDDSDGLAGPQASGSHRCRALRWHGGRDPRHADRRSRSRAGSVRPVDARARRRELRPAPPRHHGRGGDGQVRLPLLGDRGLGAAAWPVPRRARSSSGAEAPSRRSWSSSSCRSPMPSSANPT